MLIVVMIIEISCFSFDPGMCEGGWSMDDALIRSQPVDLRLGSRHCRYRQISFEVDATIANFFQSLLEHLIES